MQEVLIKPANEVGSVFQWVMLVNAFRVSRGPADIDRSHLAEKVPAARRVDSDIWRCIYSGKIFWALT